MRAARWTLVALLAWNSTSLAITYAAPNRPLTEQEVLLSSVERAGAVVTAVVLDAGDESYFERHSRDHATVQIIPEAEIKVLKTFKGPFRPNEKVRIQVPQDWGGDGRGDTVLIFLQKHFVLNHVTRPSWHLLSGPYVHGHGVKEVSPKSAIAEEAALRRAIRLAEPDSLATLADVVVIAEALDSMECRNQGRGWPCFGIYEQLYGDPIASPIHVETPVPGYVHDGIQLFYLVRSGPRGYETVGLAAGAQRIKDGRVGYGRRSLAEVRQLLRAVEKNRKSELH